MSSAVFPDDIYYAYYDPSNDKVEEHKALHSQHAGLVEQGRVGKGIRFIRGMRDTFKTSVGGTDFRMWSSVKEVIITPDGKRRILLAFDQPHTHKTQDKIYQNKSLGK